MTQVYYNTTGLNGSLLQEAITAAHTQDEIILKIFKQTGREWSPGQIYQYLTVTLRRPALLTSCRRSITNLCGAGELIKTGNQVQGIYGRPENTWIVKPAAGTQQKLF